MLSVVVPASFDVNTEFLQRIKPNICFLETRTHAYSHTHKPKEVEYFSRLILRSLLLIT